MWRVAITSRSSALLILLTIFLVCLLVAFRFVASPCLAVYVQGMPQTVPEPVLNYYIQNTHIQSLVVFLCVCLHLLLESNDNFTSNCMVSVSISSNSSSCSSSSSSLLSSTASYCSVCLQYQ